MPMATTPPDIGAMLTEKMVLDFLQQHPDFLRRHPELLEILTPPDQKMGGNVLDFQRFALGSLQRGMADMKDRFAGLLSSARDNMSAQSQVHKAALHIMRARDLDQLMEVLTQDLLHYFDVDAVRVGLESRLSEVMDPLFDPDNAMGIRLIAPGTADAILGPHQNVALVPDCDEDPPYGFDYLFSDCADIVSSCAILRLQLAQCGNDGLIAFGVREKGRFHPHLGIELLRFLSDVIALKMDACLLNLDIDDLLM